MNFTIQSYCHSTASQKTGVISTTASRQDNKHGTNVDKSMVTAPAKPNINKV